MQCAMARAGRTLRGAAARRGGMKRGRGRPSRALAVAATNRIQVGDKLPAEQQFDILDEGAPQPRQISVGEITKGKRVVLFGLPGAFTSVCSSKHVPQFNARYEKLQEKGVQTIGCVAVNDAYVMREWAKNLDVSTSRVLMLADGEAKFNEAVGLTQTLPGLGKRSFRYSLLADDGVIKILNIEEPGGMSYKISGPDHMLECIADLETKSKTTEKVTASP